MTQAEWVRYLNPDKEKPIGIWPDMFKEMQITVALTLYPIAEPPSHSLPVIVWGDKGDWERASYDAKRGRWQIVSNTGAPVIWWPLSWWSELPTVMPDGKFWYESQEERSR